MKLSSGAKANLKSEIRKRERGYWADTVVDIFNLTSYVILGTHETMEDTMIEGDRNQKTEEWETAKSERDTYLAFHLLEFHKVHRTREMMRSVRKHTIKKIPVLIFVIRSIACDLNENLLMNIR